MERLGDHLGGAECAKVEGVICMETAQYEEAESCLLRGRHLFSVDRFENERAVLVRKQLIVFSPVPMQLLDSFRAGDLFDKVADLGVSPLHIVGGFSVN